MCKSVWSNEVINNGEMMGFGDLLYFRFKNGNIVINEFLVVFYKYSKVY